MTDRRRDVGRGMLWLGSAAGFARVVDLIAIYFVLLYITKEQVGAASIIWSVGVLVETTNGLGLGVSIVQAPGLTRNQLDSIFWVVIGVAAIAGGLVIASGPLLALIYGDPAMTGYVFAVAGKQMGLAIALVPYHTLNRELRYREIASVQSGATLLAAFTRVGVAAAGGGTWALVLGHSLYGVFMAIGVNLMKPFRPRRHFSMKEIRPMLHFGIRVAATDAVNQIYCNIDYLIVGRIFGLAPLGVYRIAFDVAIQPAVVIADVISRSSLPVYARIWAAGESVRHAFRYASRSLSRVAVPLTILVALVAWPLCPLLPAGTDGNYAGAALPMTILAIAALLRVQYQLFPPVLQATGNAGSALRLSLLSLALLSLSMVASVGLLGHWLGISSVAVGWVAIYPPLLFAGVRTARTHAGLGVYDWLGSIWPALVAGAIALACGSSVLWFTRAMSPYLTIGLVVAAVLIPYLTATRLLDLAIGPEASPDAEGQHA